MGKRVQTFFLFFVLVGLLPLFGQSKFQSVSYVDEQIRAESFDKNSYGYKIFASLALNNVKGLKWTIIDFEGRVLIQTERSEDGHIYAYSKLVDYTLKGEDHFRDFPIDSLLVPSAISGILRFTDDKQVNIEQPVELLLSGGLIDLSDIQIPLDSLAKLRARIVVEKFVYTKEQWVLFQQRSRLLNLYYAYNEILSALIKKYKKEGIHKNQASSHVFLSWHEISRVSNYIKSFNFPDQLELKEFDPVDFLANQNKVIRLEKRANTLFNQVLKIKTQNSISEKKKYCTGFAGLSRVYDSLSERHQPYIAAGFSQVVRILPTNAEVEKIKLATQYYDVYSVVDSIATPQTIYNNYLVSANRSYTNEKHVLTLDLLYNAALISDRFPDIIKSPLQNELYAYTLDGLMSSYLHVAIMAYTSGSFDMADVYYQKAMEVYNLHQANLGTEPLSSDSFLTFIEQQVELAYGFLDDDKYREGLRLANQANTISKQHSLDYNGSHLDSVYRIGYVGIYKEKLDSIGNLIEDTKIDQAIHALEEAYTYSDDKESYINGSGDKELQQHAKALFNVYFERGERLLRSHEPENALFAFLEAQSINEVYLNEHHPDLDSLIYYATVPVILDLFEKAHLETWANRMDNAIAYYEEALDLQKKYELTDNAEINSAMLALSQKMDNRRCVNQKNLCFELLTKAKNRIRNKVFLEAEVFIDSAIRIAELNADCEIDISDFLNLRNANASAFQYLYLQEEVLMFVENRSYNKAVGSFELAATFYEKSQIDKFGIERPELKTIAQANAAPDFLKVCAEYEMTNNNFEEAFTYVKLLKQANYPQKESRSIQEEVAKGLAFADKESGKDLSKTVDTYTNDDKWYKYFRKAYLNNQ